MWELINTTNTLLREIELSKTDRKITRKDVAKTYALARRSSCDTEWGNVNRDILERGSSTSLKFIKKLACSGKCFS